MHIAFLRTAVLACIMFVESIAVGTPITERPPQSGRIEARTGLRMMPTFPRSPRSFRRFCQGSRQRL